MFLISSTGKLSIKLLWCYNENRGSSLLKCNNRSLRSNFNRRFLTNDRYNTDSYTGLIGRHSLFRNYNDHCKRCCIHTSIRDVILLTSVLRLCLIYIFGLGFDKDNNLRKPSKQNRFVIESVI